MREQAIAYPSEAGLAHRAIEKLFDLAKRGGVKLRQIYLPRAQATPGFSTPNNVTKLGTEVKRYNDWPAP